MLSLDASGVGHCLNRRQLWYPLLSSALRPARLSHYSDDLCQACRPCHGGRFRACHSPVIRQPAVASRLTSKVASGLAASCNIFSRLWAATCCNKQQLLPSRRVYVLWQYTSQGACLRCSKKNHTLPPVTSISAVATLTANGAVCGMR